MITMMMMSMIQKLLRARLLTPIMMILLYEISGPNGKSSLAKIPKNHILNYLLQKKKSKLTKNFIKYYIQFLIISRKSKVIIINHQNREI